MRKAFQVQAKIACESTGGRKCIPLGRVEARRVSTGQPSKSATGHFLCHMSVTMNHKSISLVQKLSP